MDGFICRRCIAELKEQEELRNRDDDDDELVAQGDQAMVHCGQMYYLGQKFIGKMTIILLIQSLIQK